jgi:hypothetical protein
MYAMTIALADGGGLHVIATDSPADASDRTGSILKNRDDTTTSCPVAVHGVTLLNNTAGSSDSSQISSCRLRAASALLWLAVLARFAGDFPRFSPLVIDPRVSLAYKQCSLAAEPTCSQARLVLRFAMSMLRATWRVREHLHLCHCMNLRVRILT